MLTAALERAGQLPLGCPGVILAPTMSPRIGVPAAQPFLFRQVIDAGGHHGVRGLRYGNVVIDCLPCSTRQIAPDRPLVKMTN